MKQNGEKKFHAFLESNQTQIDICSSNSCYVTLLENTSQAKPAHNKIKTTARGPFLENLFSRRPLLRMPDLYQDERDDTEEDNERNKLLAVES